MQNAIATWDFAPFLENIDQANAAVDAYVVVANQKLSAPRSIWQRIGLIGQRPEAELECASQAFAAADFSGAIDHSRAAESDLEAAHGRAPINVLVGAGALAGILIAAALGFRWALREEPAPTGV